MLMFYAINKKNTIDKNRNNMHFSNNHLRL